MVRCHSLAQPPSRRIIPCRLFAISHSTYWQLQRKRPTLHAMLKCSQPPCNAHKIIIIYNQLQQTKRRHVTVVWICRPFTTFKVSKTNGTKTYKLYITVLTLQTKFIFKKKNTSISRCWILEQWNCEKDRASYSEHCEWYATTDSDELLSDPRKVICGSPHTSRNVLRSFRFNKLTQYT